MSKIFYLLVLFVLSLDSVFASGPNIYCSGLPGCGSSTGVNALNFIGYLVSELIKYVAVAAVIALIVAGFMYMLSGGNEEKTKKAQKWIIWSLVAVFISISGYYLIVLINNAKIKL